MTKKNLTADEKKAAKAKADHDRYLRNKAAKGSKAAKAPTARQEAAIAPPPATSETPVDFGPAKAAKKAKVAKPASTKVPRVLRIRDLGGDRLARLAQLRAQTGVSIREQLAQALDFYWERHQPKAAPTAA